MKKTVVAASKDIASMNIAKEFGGDVVVCESSIVELSELKNVKNTLLIVASPHSSTAGIPSLSIHTTGNFGEAKVGGEPKKLSMAPALYLGAGLRKFQEIKERENLPHQVTLEVTHHGPSFNVPMIYVEIGSDKKGWKNERAARAAAEVIEYLLDLEPEGESLIGIGGPHYAPNFTKRTLKGASFGHICAKYAVSDLNEASFRQMVEKTIPCPEKLLLDWKGIPSAYRAGVEKLADSFGIVTEKFR